MGRIREHIKVNGKKCWTLFDSGARNTYVVPAVAARLDTFKLPKIFTDAVVIDDIGMDEDGKPIEILFGALAMQHWGIRLVLAEERLDLTHYPKEFVEF
ncbi:MAG: hypothetical protein HY289_16775 [Planctomycetes bacterium]|nr:hypothetical protein [Planctomycetota bacterium]